jgi:hypothetical protein
MNTYQSIYNLEWTGDKCLMSKYGPCGANGTVKVGCSGGFECIEGRCRDPRDELKTVKGAYSFPGTGHCNCQFSEDLILMCDDDGGEEKCVCREVELADARSPLWELRNYDGDKNCSVGHFGPCGEKDGVKIECHGEGMACVDGICTNPAHPRSELGEPCQDNKNCVSGSGLICAYSRKCIKPKTLELGAECSVDKECADGLACEQNGDWWEAATCTKTKG